jgi:ABC-type multidrug transport system fused ATPase/permease subunit
VLPTEGNSQTKPGKISDNWPKHGEIDFIHYTLAYQEDLPPVLKDITFKVKAQEKVGILGRTGAGKSSLASALFRLVDNSACSGSILVDGIDIAGVGLDELRQRLSIIPQDPVLFKGTIRLNLDPFERHTDAEINEAISSVHLSKKIKSLTNGIDSLVAEYGANFSVGQRQLLCLARSLLKRSRIIVMDEATAAVDGDTDQLIQTAMCSLFHDCTVLTIAHRLNTIIDCDRVLVLANGQVAEFDTPANLLRNAENFLSSSSSQNGDQSTSNVYHIFADMVAQSGPALAEQLLKAAEASELGRQSRH